MSEGETRTILSNATPARPLPDLPAGWTRYAIDTYIAAGGMGVVYRGRHLELGRSVAIKVCLPGIDPARFRREAQLLASVRSPHVVPVHDFETLSDGRSILVMDWIDGHDLQKRLHDHPTGVPEADAVGWMADVCEGMRAAEEQRVVHRDLKPSNILLDGPGCRALVADFGLARAPSFDTLTSPGGTMGTPFYMAPEQAEDPRSVDSRADIYSFGATFYHLLTGHTPFEGPTPFSVLFKHKTEPLVSPKQRRAELSTWVSDLLERCMAKNPADRFGSFADLLQTIRPTGIARSSWEFADDVALQPYLERYRLERTRYLAATDDRLAEPDRYTFPGGRTLSVHRGDLSKHAVDAVVSSDDGWLTMSGGVSAALRTAAGPTLHESALKYVPVRVGRAVVTPGGDLPARFVLHAVTIDVANSGWVLPSRDVIAEIMESCFYHADSLNLKSIAFPLLGTGTGRFSRELCLDTMFRFLARKFLHGLTTVQEARIVIFQGLPSGGRPERCEDAEPIGVGGVCDARSGDSIRASGTDSQIPEPR